MSEPLDKLFELIKTTPPPVDGEASKTAKETAIFKALEKFDEKNAPNAQGNARAPRPIDTAFAAINFWIRSFNMKKATIAAGSLCLGVLAIGIVQLQPGLFVPPQEVQSPAEPQPQPEAVAEDASPMIGADAAKNQAESKPEEYKTADVSEPQPATQPLTNAAPQTTPPAMVSAESKSKQVSGYALGAASGAANTLAKERASMPAAQAVYSDMVIYQPEPGQDKFDNESTNPLKLVGEQPVSTFSIDVDTASYAFMRSSLNSGVFPDKEQIRVEELINYFPYSYQPATSKEKPFKANVSVYPTPWNSNTKLMHIGIKGYELEQAEKSRSNLVFLIDTSGSMNEQNKLPLLINSFKLMLGSLKPDDRVAIVTYAGSAGTVLEPTLVKDKAKIISALENLNAGGSTAGAAGIREAYALAEQHKDKEGINRVILATDGDFNVGITDEEELKHYIEEKRKTGVFLSVLGFGRGNYNDALMQTLAQNGNGNAAYIDTLSEAQKVLVQEAGATLFPIAKDVKIQVEFNPTMVAEYRLIGYETRMLNREDFNNDKIDAGDIGAGHTVTAIYEFTPAGSSAKMVDGLRYAKPSPEKTEASGNGEYAFVKIRYKLPDSDASTLITTPVDKKAEYASLKEAPVDSRFATAVAAFGQKLRGGEYLGEFGYDQIIEAAESAKGDDAFGYRAEFINLVRLAKNTGSVE